VSILHRYLRTVYLRSLNSRREASTIEFASYFVISFSNGGQLDFWRVMFIIIKAQRKQIDAERHKSLLTTSCIKPDVGDVLLHPVYYVMTATKKKSYYYNFWDMNSAKW
jgi:hypothetical protein